MASMTQQTLALKKQLATALAASKTDDIKNILLQLKNNITVTEDLVRETKIGVTVSKLRSNAVKEIADLAKEIVKKWKADVGKTGGGTSSKSVGNGGVGGSASVGDSGSPSASVSAVPSPSPSASAAASPPIIAPTPTTSTSTSTNPPSKRRESISLGGTPRTHTSDGLDFNKGDRCKDDKTRDKCSELIYDALASDSDAPTEIIFDRSRSLEEYVFKQHPPPGGTGIYRQKMRSLYLNLKAANNPSLREDVVSGEISVSRLYGMSPAEMASEELKAVNRKLVEENLFKAQGATPQHAETDAFKCGKCKQNRTIYYQMQTRSADEPMTTFVTCVNCNARWKFS